MVKFHNRGECSDTFANHFAKHFKKGDAIGEKNVRKIIKARVIKEHNPALTKKIGSNE